MSNTSQTTVPSSPLPLETTVGSLAPDQDQDYSKLYKSPAAIEIYKDWYEKRLAHLKIPYERVNVETRFGYSHVLTAGPVEAPPLILLSGLMDSSIEWIRQFHLFARAGTYRRIYAFDVPGWSPVSAPEALAGTNSEYGLWLVEMMYGLGIKRADFVALGTGCGFVFKLAALTPGRISSAVLMHPYGIVAQHPFSNPVEYFTFMGAITFPRPKLVRRMVKRNLAPQSAISEETLQHNIDQFVMLKKHLKVQPIYGILKDEDLRKLNSPTLVLNGQYDKLHNQSELTARLRRLLPRVHFEVVPDAGWGIESEQPAYVNASINNFLNYTANTYRTTLPAFYNPAIYPSAAEASEETVVPTTGPTPPAQE